MSHLEAYLAAGLERKAATVLDRLQTSGPSSATALFGPGLSKWTVYRALRRLEALGMVHSTRMDHGGRAGRPWLLWSGIPVEQTLSILRSETEMRHRHVQQALQNDAST